VNWTALCYLRLRQSQNPAFRARRRCRLSFVWCLEVRGGTGDEEDAVTGNGAGVPVGLLLAGALIALAAVFWLLF
jgi:hypothetical protein